MRWLLLACLVLPLAGAQAGPRNQGYRHLNGTEIREALAGHTLSDGAHFTFHYLASGELEGSSAGHMIARTWTTTDEELCVSDSNGQVCYDVWIKGKAVKLFIGEDDISIDCRLD